MITIVQDPSPYPQIAVTNRNNTGAAVLLSQDFASAQSEMTTCTIYAYQKWVLQDRHPELANTLFQIEKVERRHYDILGRLLWLLGWDPWCQCRQGARTVVWTGWMPEYCKEPKKIIENNIAMETNAAKTYWEQSERISDPKISAMLKRLSLDEELHTKIFREYQTLFRE